MTERLLSLAIVLATALAPAGCGDEEDEIPPLTTPESATTTTPSGGDDGDGAQRPSPQDKPSGPAESGEGDPRVNELEREAERAVHEFVAALDNRDGERACELLAPGALEQIELPVTRGTCAGALEASIGYRDPRGLPVWDGSEITRVRSVEIDGETAKVVATVVTEFADRAEPSIEDDIVYLTRATGAWLIAKPSSTLYRAVGVADVPPSVLTPP